MIAWLKRLLLGHGRGNHQLARLASFLEENANPIIEVDRRGAVTYLNPSARSHFADLLFLSPSEHPIVAGLKEAMQDLKSAGKQSLTREVAVGNKIYEQHISYVSETDVVRSYNVDITERKQVERLKDEFLSVVSHELRTPLSTIKEFNAMLADQIAGPVTPAQREYLSIVKTNVDRLARIIDDLLDMAKIESGQTFVNRELIEVRSFVDQVLQSLRPLAANKALTLETQLPGGALEVFADADKLTQVLVNLLGNAIKFSPDPGTITVRVADQPTCLEFSIEDHGVGIAEEDFPKLFQRFQQLKPMAGGSGARGTGLGLAISKRLIELHGGRIWVASASGNGSTFFFTLPKYHPEELFHEYFKAGIEQAKRKQSCFSIVVVSVQSFQELKTQHGPEAMNQLMKDVEQLLRHAVRQRAGDTVVRWRRGEMVVILAEVTRDGAIAMAGRIRRMVEDHPFAIGGTPLTLAVATATATYPQEAVTEDELLAMTERRLRQTDAPKFRIMVVDDEPKIRQFMKQVLEHRDYEVITAASGPEAFEQLKTYKVDLMLLDVMMPVMDGYEVYHLLREHPKTKDIPIIIVTAKGERKDRQLGLKMDTYRYLTKPFQVEELLAQVRETLLQQTKDTG